MDKWATSQSLRRSALIRERVSCELTMKRKQTNFSGTHSGGLQRHRSFFAQQKPTKMLLAQPELIRPLMLCERSFNQENFFENTHPLYRKMRQLQLFVVWGCKYALVAREQLVARVSHPVLLSTDDMLRKFLAYLLSTNSYSSCAGLPRSSCLQIYVL